MTNLRHNLLIIKYQNTIKMSEIAPILRRDRGRYFTISLTLLACGKLSVSHVSGEKG